jgi:HPt (histidine-containing phosphotransfer) domain-containing protein
MKCAGAITHIEQTALYSELASDPDYAELVEMFVGEMSQRVERLQNQFAERNWRELTTTAHQLKGAAGSYGFPAITPAAARLEQAVRSGQMEDDIEQCLAELVTLCRSVRAGTPS